MSNITKGIFMATKLQQYQISGSFQNDINDKVEQSAFLKENRTLIDDLNSLRTQVRNILGYDSWMQPQAINLTQVKGILGTDDDGNVSLAANLEVMAGSTKLASLQVNTLSDKHVVLAGKDGELQQSDNFKYDNELGLVTLGGTANNVVGNVELYNGYHQNPGVQINGGGTMQLGGNGVGNGYIVAAGFNGTSNVVVSTHTGEGVIEIMGSLFGKQTARLDGGGKLELGGNGYLAGGVIMRDEVGSLKVDINPLKWSLSDPDGIEAVSLENNGVATFAKGVEIGSNGVAGALAIRNESGDPAILMSQSTATFQTELLVAEDATFSADVTIGGNLTVTGTTTTLDTQNLRVEDPVILLGSGNVFPDGTPKPADFPLGLVLNGGTYQGSGMFIGTQANLPRLQEKVVFAAGNYGADGTVDLADQYTKTAGLVANSVSFCWDGQGEDSGGEIFTTKDMDEYGNLTSNLHLTSYNRVSLGSFGTGAALSKSWDEWMQFREQFGDGTSLVGAIVGASGGAASGANQKVQRKGSFLAGSNTFSFSAEMNGKKLRTDSYDTAIRDLDVYLNGMLLTLAHPDNLVEGDYSLMGQGTIAFNFTVTDDDVITVVLRNAQVEGAGGGGGGGVPA